MSNRRCYLIRTDKGTHCEGVIIAGDERFNTLELPYKNNAPYISAVKDDVYQLFADHKKNAHNRTVMEMKPKNGRSQCQFHYTYFGNIESLNDRLQGCVGLKSLSEELRFVKTILNVFDEIEIITIKEVK